MRRIFSTENIRYVNFESLHLPLRILNNIHARWFWIPTEIKPRTETYARI